MTAIEVLEQMAMEFESEARGLKNAAQEEARASRYIRDDAARRASAIYREGLRDHAQVLDGCARKLRDRATAMRNEEAE